MAGINLNVIAAGFFGTFTFVPVIDGSFITQSPTVALSQGKVNGVKFKFLRESFYKQVESNRMFCSL